LRLALTGTNGFLGRAFAAAALAAGDAVRGLVLPGTAGVPRGVEPVAGALSDEAALRELLRGCDALVHLAALGVQGRDRDFERMTQVNVVEPIGLLQAAAAAGVQRVVAVGTCLEYAGHGRLPDAPCATDVVVGEDAPTEPDDAYGATKAAGGLLLRARARALGLPLRYLRFASMYGPGDDAAKLLPGAIRAAVTRTPFPMTPGAQVREWLHVDDGVAALRAALAAPLRSVELVNVGTGEGVALRDVVGMVFEEAGADPGLIRAGERTYRQGEVHRVVMDCARARGLLAGWAPQRSLRSGIAALVRSEREEGRERT
jgi:dTDP-6-deoxy-L-talose 4-dehydrogenase (NAD+)